eukprot:403344365
MKHIQKLFILLQFSYLFVETLSSCIINQKPLVSIITASFNTGQHLEWNIWSVRNQTYQNWELIIVDDGSYDETTLDILDIYPNIDQRIKVIKLNSNYGIPPTARNLAIQHAKGEFLHIMDDDDLIHPNKTELQVNFLLKYPHLDGVYSRFHYIDSNNSILGESSKYGGVDTELLALKTLYYNTLQLITAMFRLNNKTREHLYFVHEYSDDWLLTRHVLISSKFQMYFMEKQILAGWRQYPPKTANKLTDQVLNKSKEAEIMKNSQSSYLRLKLSEEETIQYYKQNRYEIDSLELLKQNYGFLFADEELESVENKSQQIDQETQEIANSQKIDQQVFEDLKCAIMLGINNCEILNENLILMALQNLRDYAEDLLIRDYNKYEDGTINDVIDPCTLNYIIPIIQGHQSLINLANHRIR